LVVSLLIPDFVVPAAFGSLVVVVPFVPEPPIVELLGLPVVPVLPPTALVLLAPLSVVPPLAEPELPAPFMVPLPFMPLSVPIVVLSAIVIDESVAMLSVLSELSFPLQLTNAIPAHKPTINNFFFIGIVFNTNS
jgi:hypothetical protein